MTYLFVINPSAGGGRPASYRPKIEAYMKKTGLKFSIVESSKDQATRELVLKNADKYDIFVAVGGDGSIKELAEGVYEAGKTLAIIPAGTANDLAKSLGIRGGLRANLDRIIRGRTRQMDVGWVNSGFFLNVASLGYDSRVIVNYNRIGFIRGRLKYLLAAIYSFFKFENLDVELDIDGRSHKSRILLLALGSGKYYGGFFKILPGAQLDDGRLHICLIENISRLKVFLLSPSLIGGFHPVFKKHVRLLSGKRISLRSQQAFYLNLDGEILEKTDRADFSIGRDKLKIIY